MPGEPDYQAAWKEWSGSAAPGLPKPPEANAKILGTLDPLVTSAARTHVGDVNPMIKGRARAMTLDAMDGYDPSRGKLSTHVYSHLRGLKRYNARAKQLVSVPERVVLDRMAVERSSTSLADELGREPTEDELADHSGLPARRIRHVRSFPGATWTGRYAEHGEDGTPYDPEMAPMPSASRAWSDLVVGDLHPVDQKIVEYTRAGMSNQDVARKLRLTPGAISQRKLKIQKLLDEEQDISPFI